MVLCAITRFVTLLEACKQADLALLGHMSDCHSQSLHSAYMQGCKPIDTSRFLQQPAQTVSLLQRYQV